MAMMVILHFLILLLVLIKKTDGGENTFNEFKKINKKDDLKNVIVEINVNLK